MTIPGATSRFVANISTLYRDLPLLERPARAAKAGFDYVEAWWPFDSGNPSSGEIDDFVGAIAAAGVELTGLNLFAGDMAAGERGIACVTERRQEFDQALVVLRDIAERTGCRRFNCLWGQYDDARSADVQAASAVDAVAHAAEVVAEIGGTILLEPLARGLNGSYPLETDEDVLEIIDGPLRERGVANVELLFDTFHLGSNGVDLVDAARRLGHRIGHIQIADYPGRHEPGTGDLPIAEVVQQAIGAGYAGLLACEYIPLGDTDGGLQWIRDFELHLPSVEEGVK